MAQSGADLLPEDVLRHLSLCMSLADVREAVLVCRAWAAAFCSDAVWVPIARRYFPQLPLLSLAPPVRWRHGERIRIKTKQKRAASAGGHSTCTAFVTPPPPKPAFPGAVRESFIEKRCELHLHHSDLQTQLEVRSQQPYILHAILSIAWVATIIFMVQVIAVTEELTDAIDITHAFATLNAAFSLIIISIIFNVTVSAHFVPVPLLERFKRHSQLISITAICTVCVLALWAIVQMFRHNVTSEADARLPYVVCFSPVLGMIVFWQCLAILAARPVIMRWLRRPGLLSSKQIFACITTCFPGALAFSMWSLSQFLESGGTATRYIVAASAVPLWGTTTVTCTFTADYLWHTRKKADLIAAVSMASLSAFLMGFVVFEPRGFLILPLLLFFICFTISYVRQWLKRGNRLRDLRAMGSRVARMRR
eukprot:TRINITY_DN6558_c1_g1_i1.p3 TRINITY_DN6558_c1_g1~~TRINITY_DN6558_c1_g1_i1.p3  ORF type:complete len:423 (+),score=128.52 TRINITY_DN6558_c1_g1_i1:83-1351(+)